MNRTLDEITPDELSSVMVEVTNPETPFGGVQVFGVSDAPIQIVLREGEQGDPGPVGPPGPTGEAGPPSPDQPEFNVSAKGVTSLVSGQGFVDVVFPGTQPDSNWSLLECFIANETDANPLNIGVGILTSRTTSGFRRQLIGNPDSVNYKLHWAISGVVVPPTPATTYLLSGPDTGASDAPSTIFTAELPSGQTVTGTLTVTPDDSSGGGTFTPSSVALTTLTPMATFTYTPGSAGTKTIRTTNSGGLSDPASLSYNAVAPFSPADITGLKLWLKADSMALADGAAINHWNDSSSNAYNLTSGTATFKSVGGPNGKPFVRFNGTSDRLFTTVDMGFGTVDHNVYIVFKCAPSAQRIFGNSTPGGLVDGGLLLFTDGSGHFGVNTGSNAIGTVVVTGASFHVNTLYMFTGGSGVYSFVDGAADMAGPNSGGASSFGQLCIGGNRGSTFSAVDICEIIVYQPIVAGPTDNSDLIHYLGDKYGIPVTGLLEKIADRIRERQ